MVHSPKHCRSISGTACHSGTDGDVLLHTDGDTPFFLPDRIQIHHGRTYCQIALIRRNIAEVAGGADPVLLGLGQKRRLNFMAKDELFSNKFFAFIIRHLGAFPVKRGAGDGKAIKNGEDIINEGNLMTIFIEGGRSKTGELMRPRSGFAVIAQQTGASVVPTCITKIGKRKLFAKRIIHFSDPISVEELGLDSIDRRALKNAGKIVMGKIQEMRENDLNEYSKH